MEIAMTVFWVIFAALMAPAAALAVIGFIMAVFGYGVVLPVDWAVEKLKQRKNK